MGSFHQWQGAAVLLAPATLQNGLPGGWDGPWHSYFAPCCYKDKHGARENAGVVWCMPAFLMPLPHERLLSPRDSFPGHSTGLSGAMGKETPELLFWACLLQRKY